MGFDHARCVEFRIAKTRGRDRRGLRNRQRCCVVSGYEDGFDGDEIVNDFSASDRIIETDEQRAADFRDISDPDGRTRPGKRVAHVRAGDRVGEGHAAVDEHGRKGLRASGKGLRRARVIAVGRNAAWIVADDETEPRLASLRSKSKHAMLVPGDIVDVREIAEDRTVIDHVEPRSFALMRRTPGGRTKTMAANINSVAIVAALADPPLHLTMIDQLIAFAVQHEVEVLLLLTKVDLAGEEMAERTAALYRSLEVPTLILQPTSGRGVDAFRAMLETRKALLVGNSGVGKSTIFKALGGIGVVGDISRFGRGKQTTTSARLARMGEGFLIDSPGIGEFALDPLPPAEIAYLFVEMREPATRCRFSNCRHLQEPDCAVRAAVDAGTMAESRYASYREMVLNPQPLAW